MFKILNKLKLIFTIIGILVTLIIVLGIVFAVVFLLNKVGIISDADLTSFTPTTTTTSISANGNFLEAARQCHEYVRVNKFTYGSRGTIPLTSSSSKEIDCSMYVSWVLYEYGYTNISRLTCSGGTLVEWCNNNLELVWKAESPSEFTHNLSDIENIQAGDICVMGSKAQVNGTTTKHTQIFAGYSSEGKGIWYNCGSTDSIQAEEGTNQYNTYGSDSTKGFLYVYRVPSLT